MSKDSRTVLGGAFVLGMLLLLVAHRETFLSMIGKWESDAAFSHGYLILPIAAWLAWRKRAEVRAAYWQPSWIGALGLVLATALWIVARGTGVLVVQQFAVIAMIPMLVTAMLGPQVVRTLAFPLAFLFFAVPAGRALVPILMQVTADLATLGLQLSGIPVLRSHMYIIIPGGWFEVAKACSGLNYFVTGVVLGVLYAYMSFTSWKKRLLCVAAWIFIPVIANALRVYITIAVSHLTNMRFGPGQEHVTFGRIFFVLIVFLMFWISHRWRDEQPAIAAVTPREPQDMARARWAIVALAAVTILAGPPYFDSAGGRAASRFDGLSNIVGMPRAAAGWQGPDGNSPTWRPLYVDALAEASGSYTDSAGSRVDVFVGAYALGATRGAELISYRNRISAEEHRSLAAESRVRLDLGDALQHELHAREIVVEDSGGERLVWYWFKVGDRTALSPYVVKALEGWAFVTRDAAVERIVTLATPLDREAHARLERFAMAHAACVASGFAAEDCGG